jgi:hypothetical protein
VWSGRFRIDRGYGRKHGFFLARGLVCMAPIDLMHLLWDNSRTAEYNRYCLGRSTLHTINDNSDCGGGSGEDDADDDDKLLLLGRTDTATKIIRSEMRVPFAGITVAAVCVMHVRPIPNHGGYVIVSRTLDCGTAGVHANSFDEGIEKSSSSKNEILWGVNVLRTVPGHPGSTDLVSLSQVGSGVPNFLAQKIGLMGLSDFFRNVRAVALLAGSGG